MSLSCPYCGAAQDSPVGTCTGCGRDKTAPRRVCPFCGGVSLTAETICCHCSQKFGSELSWKIPLIVFLFITAFVIAIMIQML